MPVTRCAAAAGSARFRHSANSIQIEFFNVRADFLGMHAEAVTDRSRTMRFRAGSGEVHRNEFHRQEFGGDEIEIQSQLQTNSNRSSTACKWSRHTFQLCAAWYYHGRVYDDQCLLADSEFHGPRNDSTTFSSTRPCCNGVDVSLWSSRLRGCFSAGNSSDSHRKIVDVDDGRVIKVRDERLGVGSCRNHGT